MKLKESRSLPTRFINWGDKVNALLVKQGLPEEEFFFDEFDAGGVRVKELTKEQADALSKAGQGLGADDPNEDDGSWNVRFGF